MCKNTDMFVAKNMPNCSRPLAPGGVMKPYVRVSREHRGI